MKKVFQYAKPKTKSETALFSVNFEKVTCGEHSKECALDLTEISPVLIGPISLSQRKITVKGQIYFF